LASRNVRLAGTGTSGAVPDLPVPSVPACRKTVANPRWVVAELLTQISVEWRSPAVPVGLTIGT
jgi:hypothetical protein